MSRRTQTFDCFVGNVPKDATEKDVGKSFSKFGEIAGIFIKDSNQANGNRIAFVRYHCEPDAERAINEVNGTELESHPGTKIHVKHADPNKKRTGPGPGPGPGRPSPQTRPEGEQKAVHFTGPDIVPAEDRSGTSLSIHNTSGGSGGGIQDIKGEKETVMVTYVESPITLWAQIVNEDNTDKLIRVTNELTDKCPKADKIVGPPEFNKLYAARFSEDGMWYRCMLKQNFGTDRMKVQYVDYGNTEEVGQDTLVELPAGASNIRSLATKLVLHNTIARDLSDQKGIQFLRNLLDGKMAKIVRTRQLADGSGHYAFVFVDDVSVNERIINEGHAKQRPSMQKGPPSAGGGDNPPSLAPFNKGPNMGPNMGRPLIGGGGDVRMPGSIQHVQSMNRGPTKEQFEQQQALQNELTKKNRELAKIRNEKDVVTMELQNMRGKQANLKEENSALTNRLLQSTLSHKVQTVIKLANTVRSLRSQFPSGKGSCLEDCMTLARSSEKVQNTSVSSLQSVVSGHATYQAAQKEISTCQDAVELSVLIKARDAARQELHSKLQSCMDELNQMPLDERSTAVKKAEKQLVAMYSGFTSFIVHSCPQLDDIFPAFREWKSKKDIEFREVRNATDMTQNALNSALTRLQELFTLDSELNSGEEHLDMDKLLQSYIVALQHEVTVTDLEHSRDASLVATVVAAVRKDLQLEVETLDNFTHLMTQFRKIKQDIEPWLNGKPDLAGIQESRKCLRKLKSKLRHKLADKQDLEEGDGSGSELENVKAEVENIKHELHLALVRSDSLMGELAGLADEHFPELLIQHPDLGIDMQLSYNGIVKTGRDIEHYTLSPGFRAGFYKTTFAGESVLLQEFNIGGSDHRSREDFMKDIVCYTSSQPDSSVLPVQAVFFSKTERQAYIQTKSVETETLESVVRKSPMSEKAVQTVVINVTRGLSYLHACGFIHGDVTPQNILIQENGAAVLLMPDFSKAQVERVRKRYTTDSGIVFQLPELIMNPTCTGFTSFADVYNIGLLILWLHHPDTPFYCKPDGIPDFSCVSLQPEVCTVLENVLLGLPELRVSCEKLLSSYYLSVPKPDPPAPTPPARPESPLCTEVPSSYQMEEDSLQMEVPEHSSESPSAETETSAPECNVEALTGHSDGLETDPVIQIADSMPLIDQDTEPVVAAAEQVSEVAPSSDGDVNADNTDISAMLENEQVSNTVTSNGEIVDTVLPCEQNTCGIEGQEEDITKPGNEGICNSVDHVPGTNENAALSGDSNEV